MVFLLTEQVQLPEKIPLVALRVSLGNFTGEVKNLCRGYVQRRFVSCRHLWKHIPEIREDLNYYSNIYVGLYQVKTYTNCARIRQPLHMQVSYQALYIPVPNAHVIDKSNSIILIDWMSWIVIKVPQ